MTLKVIRLSFPQSNSYGKNRVIINCVKPEIDCRTHPIKRGVGEKNTLQANIFGDGHSEIFAILFHCKRGIRMVKTSMTHLVNENLLFYGIFLKYLSNAIIIIGNLVHFNTQSGNVKLPSSKLGISNEQTFLAHDLLSDGKYFWHRQSYAIQLSLNVIPAHIFKLKKQLRREEEIDYFV